MRTLQNYYKNYSITFFIFLNKILLVTLLNGQMNFFKEFLFFSKIKSTIMSKAKKGDNVKVHYKGKLTSGEQFDSSEGREPLAFTVGAGQMIKGFDEAIPGMVVGEKKTINIAPENAYGEKNMEAIIEFPKSNIPPDMKLEPGMKLQLQNEEGQPIPVVVTEVKDNVVILDANHELAGKELIFDIELVEIMVP